MASVQAQFEAAAKHFESIVVRWSRATHCARRRHTTHN